MDAMVFLWWQAACDRSCLKIPTAVFYAFSVNLRLPSLSGGMIFYSSLFSGAISCVLHSDKNCPNRPFFPVFVAWAAHALAMDERRPIGDPKLRI